jgi:hypothetical protein
MWLSSLTAMWGVRKGRTYIAAIAGPTSMTANAASHSIPIGFGYSDCAPTLRKGTVRDALSNSGSYNNHVKSMPCPCVVSLAVFSRVTRWALLSGRVIATRANWRLKAQGTAYGRR